LIPLQGFRHQKDGTRVLSILVGDLLTLAIYGKEDDQKIMYLEQKPKTGVTDET
jgi:hypothetical protein